MRAENLERAIDHFVSAVEGWPQELIVGTQALEETERYSRNGLDPESLEKSLRRFYTTKPVGLGMGLSISRLIAENHSGPRQTTTLQSPFSSPSRRFGQ